MDTGGIGRRIAYWRERRGFTQADFGRHMEQSVRWVQSLEGGQRQQDPRVSVLLRAAAVLRVPLEQLLTDSEPAPAAGPTPPAHVAGVINALYERLPDTAAPVPLARLRTTLTHCCHAFQACHHRALGQQLPGLILHTQRAADEAADDAREVFVLLSRTLQVTASLLHKFGADTASPAAVAADRALAAAERSGDAVAIGAASRRVAKCLARQNQSRAAVNLAVDTARRLEGELSAGGPVGLSTLGMLYLNAATATARERRTPAVVAAANGHLDHAAHVAEQQGGDMNADYTSFGPTNVGMHRVDVLTRFEDGWSALAAAETVTSEAFAGIEQERKVQHLITTARAQMLSRDKAAAGAALLQAAAVAPEEITGRQSSRDLVKDVVGAMPQPDSALRELAHRCGLPA